MQIRQSKKAKNYSKTQVQPKKLKVINQILFLAKIIMINQVMQIKINLISKNQVKKIIITKNNLMHMILMLIRQLTRTNLIISIIIQKRME